MQQLLFFAKGGAMATLKDVRDIYGDHTVEAMGRYHYYSVLVPFVEKEGKRV